MGLARGLRQNTGGHASCLNKVGNDLVDPSFEIADLFIGVTTLNTISTHDSMV